MLMTEGIELYLSRPNLSSNTRKLYQFQFGQFVRWMGDRELEAVQQADLMRYIALKQQLGASPRHINLITNLFKSLFAWFCKNEYSERNPALRLECVHVEPIPDEERAIAPQDWQKIKQYAREHSPRDYALLCFMLDTACRVSAAATLRLKGLDIANLRAVGYEAKIRSRVEWAFGEECGRALNAWLEVRPQVEHDYCFTGVLSPYDGLRPHSIREMMKRVCAAAGVPAWTPHSLRHATLQNLARKADVTLLDVQTKANHLSPKTTLENYYPQKSRRIGELSKRYSLVDDAPDDGDKPPILRLLPKPRSKSS